MKRNYICIKPKRNKYFYNNINTKPSSSNVKVLFSKKKNCFFINMYILLTPWSGVIGQLIWEIIIIIIKEKYETSQLYKKYKNIN